MEEEGSEAKISNNSKLNGNKFNIFTAKLAKVVFTATHPFYLQLQMGYTRTQNGSRAGIS